MINKLSNTIEKTKTLFLNFEDERLELEVDELDLILQSFSELYPNQELKSNYSLYFINTIYHFCRHMRNEVFIHIIVYYGHTVICRTIIETLIISVYTKVEKVYYL